MINHFKKGDRVVRVNYNGAGCVKGSKHVVAYVTCDRSHLAVENSVLLLASNFKHLITCKVK